MRVRWISERYMVREDGTVWVLKKKPHYMRQLKGKPPSKTCKYTRIAFGRAHEFLLHQVVAAAFHGPCPEGMVVLHWDDDPMNNHASNLRYGTRAENVADSIRIGAGTARNHGERHPLAKFTAEQVEEMRKDRAAGMQLKDLRDKYGCSQAYASLVTRGHLRRHDGAPEKSLQSSRNKRPQVAIALKGFPL